MSDPIADAPGDPDAVERVFVIPLAGLVWMAIAALFVAIRLWPVWGTPVGGAELVHLSGAWNAHAGVDDPRYVPTLFQAVAAGLFSFTISEVPARLLAFAATATVPLALWTARDRLGGDIGALVALALLAFDAPSLAVGSESGAMGFDLAITLLLFTCATRGDLKQWQWAAIAVLVSTGGPLPLPLVAGLLVGAFLRGGRMDLRAVAWPAGGIVFGVAFATLRPGLGPDGFTIAPFELFGAAYEQEWSTADGLSLAIMTALPVILFGIAGAAWRLVVAWRGERLLPVECALLLWGAFALGWFLTSLPSHAVAPVAGVTIPAALLAGPAIADLASALRRADWTLARYLVPGAGAGLAVIAFYIGDWAKLNRVGDAQDKLIVTGLAFAVLAIIGALAADRQTLPIVGGMAVAIGVVLMLVATSAIAFRAGDSPVPSPVSRAAARELRDIAVEAARDRGTIVIHRDFEDELTWPFRDSGTVVVASRVPADAAIVIWPAAGPAALGAPPAGFAAIEEEWALVERIEPPTRFLQLVRWYSDRYSLDNTREPIAVYVKEGE